MLIRKISNHKLLIESFYKNLRNDKYKYYFKPLKSLMESI